MVSVIIGLGLLAVGLGISLVIFRQLNSEKELETINNYRLTTTMTPPSPGLPLIASCSPVTTRGGKRLRRKRRDGARYMPGDNIWDDLLFMDCFDLLDVSSDFLRSDESLSCETMMGSDTTEPDTIAPVIPITEAPIIVPDPAMIAYTDPEPVHSAPEPVHSAPEPVYAPEPSYSNSDWGGGGDSSCGGGSD